MVSFDDDIDDNVTGEDDNEDNDEGDDEFESQKNIRGHGRPMEMDKNLITRSKSSSLLSKGSTGSVIRIHSNSGNRPRLLRRYYSGHRASVPVRLQTSHSHTIPHYYIPHTYTDHTSGAHHHISLPEKSGTWLGSGLAAGILIGAIPFGIMMASMMPTLFTGTMPIVNTAAVGKRRRRRSILMPTLTTATTTTTGRALIDQLLLEKLSILFRRGIVEIISLLNEQQHLNNYNLVNEKNNNKNNDYHHQVPPLPSASASSTSSLKRPEPLIGSTTNMGLDWPYLSERVTENANNNNNNIVTNNVMKTVARYALAAMDEPKCIKEMLCAFMADGKHLKTTPLQKTLYLLIKW